MAATAQAQAEASKETQRAGIAHAKEKKAATAYRGRKPSFNRSQFDAAQALLASDAPVAHIAKLCGVNRQTDPVACLAMLDRRRL